MHIERQLLVLSSQILVLGSQSVADCKSAEPQRTISHYASVVDQATQDSSKFEPVTKNQELRTKNRFLLLHLMLRGIALARNDLYFHVFSLLISDFKRPAVRGDELYL